MKKRKVLLVICAVILLCALVLNACGAAKELSPEEKIAQNMAQAKTCEGKDVSELYKLIGQPNDSFYGPSCAGDGEDGELYYDGFTVHTYKSDIDEQVVYVGEE